jgi:hypothetical protein
MSVSSKMPAVKRESYVLMFRKTTGPLGLFDYLATDDDQSTGECRAIIAKVVSDREGCADPSGPRATMRTTSFNFFTNSSPFLIMDFLTRYESGSPCIELLVFKAIHVGFTVQVSSSSRSCCLTTSDKLHDPQWKTNQFF